MTRLAVLAVAACMLAAAFATPASAAYTKCAMTDDYTLTKVDGVGCKRAKTILNRFYADNDSTPGGFTCKQKQYEGGATTTCRKPGKRIKQYVAD